VSEPARIGVFGGTFDPPHLGHLIAAQDSCSALKLDRLLFVPAANPPHKVASGVSPAVIRLEMLEAAVADNRSFDISTIELERSGPSYTVDTLRALRTVWPGCELNLLIGVDQVREFSSWHEGDEVQKLARIVMLERSGSGSEGQQASFVRQTVAVTRVDISSTLIRSRVREGESIRYLVPAAVAEIIARERLYR
jgi:nicotinate-nucleotide adenylyltransferase